MSHKIEEFVKAEKKLNANVDFYSASTYQTLGIDVDLFTPVFAVSRISGWAAHVIEQLDDNRLIRPRADYVGPAYPQQLRAHRAPLGIWAGNLSFREGTRRHVLSRRTVGGEEEHPS